jgi:FkbM family methyltransferase
MTPMLLDAVSAETPRLTRPDGRALPPLLTGPPIGTRLWRRGVARLRIGRLPSMLATFADGRRFGIDAGDIMYEQIYRLGEYEPELTGVIRGLLRPGDFAVDVGANHGWFTVLMARTVGASGVVWAIEPGAAMLAALRENLALNDGRAVIVHELALGDDNGEVDLHIFADLPHGHASTARLGDHAYKAQRVLMRTLDDLLEAADGPPALVKVDVEGAERDVLLGARATLAAERSMWLLEVNYDTAAAFGYLPIALLERFNADYAVYRLDGDGPVPETDPSGAPHGATWLFAPPEHAARVEGIAGA